MDEYYDLYYPDGRNARRVVRAAPPGSRAVFVPPPSATPAPASSPFTRDPVAAAPAPAPMPAPGYYGAPPQMQYGYPPPNPQYAAPYPQQYAAPYPQQYAAPQYGYPPYSAPYGAPAPYYATAPALNGLLGLLGNGSIGPLVEMGTAGFAALQELPPAPTATDDVATNLQNILIYQTALANHAKRNERVRTLGSLVGKLLG
jgi:hypothetical protein